MNQVVTLFILFVSESVIAGVFLEPGAGLLYDESDFRQNNTTQSIEHDGRGVGVEGFARAGLGLGSLRLGVVGSVSAISLRHRARYDRVVRHYETYSNTFHQYLLGPHVALVSSSSGIRLFGEYYNYCHRKVTYNDGDSTNHFRKYDEFDGFGWGAGIGLYRQFGATSLLYRNLRFNQFDFKGGDLRTDVLNQTFKPQQIHEVVLQISFPLDAAGRLFRGKSGGSASSGESTGKIAESKKGDAFFRNLLEVFLKSKVP